MHHYLNNIQDDSSSRYTSMGAPQEYVQGGWANFFLGGGGVGPKKSVKGGPHIF